MIANKDLYAEIGSIDETNCTDVVAYRQALLKAQTLQLKLLQNIRANMVRIMVHHNIPLVESKKKKDDTVEE